MTKAAPTRAEKEAARKRSYARRKTEEAAEIGPPPITPAQRRKGTILRRKCRDNLLLFNTEVFPNSTGMKPLGPVQINSISQDEATIRRGGRICKAEPRGYGKTTRGANAALWGVLYEYRRMIPVFSANMEKSKMQIMARWKAEFLGNDLLFWMFPELIWPLRALDNTPQRGRSQTFNGKRTNVEWTADRIVLPFLSGVRGAGGILMALPLKSARGATHTLPDGTVLRPDLVLLDDVQKDEDADNPNTIRKISDLIDHTAMRLGGHSFTMSAIMNCTVRQPKDLSETYLAKPGWRRVRYRMLDSPSEREDLWLGEYAAIRQDFDPEDPDDQDRAKLRSLELYLANREVMDRGAAVTWDHAYAWADDPQTEVSAIQHAYNILIDEGESVFKSECQNQPVDRTERAGLMTAEQIQQKQNGVDRGGIPHVAEKLVLHVDVQQNCLAWTAVAGSSRYECGVVDYRHFPEQSRLYVERKHMAPDFDSLYPGQQVEGQIHSALGDLLAAFELRGWVREDGLVMRPDLVLIDSGNWTDTIMLFCGAYRGPLKVMGAQGFGVGAKDTPFAQRKRNQGETHGHHFIVKPSPKNPALQYMQVDTNYWKSKLHELLRASVGSDSYLALYHAQEVVHRMIADHYRAETPVRTAAKGREVDEWQILPHRPENEFLDNTVACLAGLAYVGCVLPGTPMIPQRGQAMTLRQLREGS